MNKCRFLFGRKQANGWARLGWLCMLFFLPALPGCFEEEKIEISYIGFNRTEEDALFITINGSGGIAGALAGGESSGMCCVVLPKIWRPGLQVIIGWQADGHWLLDEQGREVIRNGNRVLVSAPRKERTVTVPEYSRDEQGSFHIHFLPGDKVEVVRSFVYPEHPQYQPVHLRHNTRK